MPMNTARPGLLLLLEDGDRIRRLIYSENAKTEAEATN
jgi:hypothetical protein